MILVLASVAAVLLGAGVFWGGPSELAWLQVHDALEPAEVIVVMNGENTRADEAAALFRAGYGREIWLTNDPRSSSGAIDAGTAENLRRLAAAGVPDDAIRQMPSAATSTRAELQQIGAELRRRGLDRAIVITSKLHGRRVRLLWTCAVGESPRAIMHAPLQSHYVGPHVVRHELLGIVPAWLCLR